MEGFGFCGVSLRFGWQNSLNAHLINEVFSTRRSSNALFFLICETCADAVGHCHHECAVTRWVFGRICRKFFPTPSFQPDSPLPMSGIDRWILPPEAFCLRKKFPRCIASALRTGVLLPPEDGLR